VGALRVQPRKHDTNFHLQEGRGFERGGAQRVVRLRQYQLPYDFLILATGIQYNYFGHDDWRSVAPGLESLDDADLIRGKVLTAFERAEEKAALDHSDRAEIQQLLTFVLVGAGTVGVEMAGTLSDSSKRDGAALDFAKVGERAIKASFQVLNRPQPTPGVPVEGDDSV
jgi:NADH dehydrogenase